MNRINCIEFTANAKCYDDVQQDEQGQLCKERCAATGTNISDINASMSELTAKTGNDMTVAIKGLDMLCS
jgi:hypothetical protein